MLRHLLILLCNPALVQEVVQEVGLALGGDGLLLLPSITAIPRSVRTLAVQSVRNIAILLLKLKGRRTLTILEDVGQLLHVLGDAVHELLSDVKSVGDS